MINAADAAMVAITKNPLASPSVPPAQNTIGKDKEVIKIVPIWAPSILKPVKFVLSWLSDEILGVKEEKGTLTIVKHVLCNMLIKISERTNNQPSNGGIQNNRIKDKASGKLPKSK